MKIKSIIMISILLSLSMIVTACGPKTTATAPLSASLSEIQGTVLAKKSGQADFTRISGGFVLEQNGAIQTGNDGRVRLDLSTGTIIRIAPASLFTLVSNTPDNNSLSSSFKLDIGQIFIILNGGSANVQTPSGVASVRGSYLMVEVVPGGGVKLTCLEGDCNLKNDSGDFPLSTGQSAFILNAQTPPFIQPMSNEEIQQWLNQNPEATVVVPSLTAPAPSATSISTATSKPTFTSAPPTATTQPTATTAPTATTPPNYNPPPAPKPQPIVQPPTPDPNALVYLVSNIDINNGGRNVNVNPGGLVTVNFIYILWNQAGCPTCIDQLVVGLDDGQSRTGAGCGYNGIPFAYPGTGPSYSSSSPVTFYAPTTSGTYSVGIDLIQQNGCQAALPSYGTTGNYQIIGSITVP